MFGRKKIFSPKKNARGNEGISFRRQELPELELSDEDATGDANRLHSVGCGRNPGIPGRRNGAEESSERNGTDRAETLKSALQIVAGGEDHEGI